jgi:hypothetical protein
MSMTGGAGGLPAVQKARWPMAEQFAWTQPAHGYVVTVVVTDLSQIFVQLDSTISTISSTTFSSSPQGPVASQGFWIVPSTRDLRRLSSSTSIVDNGAWRAGALVISGTEPMGVCYWDAVRGLSPQLGPGLDGDTSLGARSRLSDAVVSRVVEAILHRVVAVGLYWAKRVRFRYSWISLGVFQGQGDQRDRMQGCVAHVYGCPGQRQFAGSPWSQGVMPSGNATRPRLILDAHSSSASGGGGDGSTFHSRESMRSQSLSTAFSFLGIDSTPCHSNLGVGAATPRSYMAWVWSFQGRRAQRPPLGAWSV